MRYIILDTETTGLDPKQGHRVIEIAGVEVVDRRLTGRHVHYYLDPEREIDAGATDVHGLTWETLRDKPKFGDIGGELIEFARGARWIIHNAPFDLEFLDWELAKVGLPSTAAVCAEVIDTLELAREQFPGKRNSLDALRALRGRECASHAARRAARRGAARGGVSRDDARAGVADH